MRTSLVALLVLFCACGGERLQKKNDPDPIPVPTCGDGKIDPGEACDGSDLGGASCTSEGFDFGTLTCTADCQLATGACVKRCGNGKLDPGEQCDGPLGALACADWGYKQCTNICGIDTLHCTAEAFKPGSPLNQSAGGPTLITDLAPEGYGDLVTAVPDFARLQTHAYETTTRSFSEARRITHANGALPSLPIAADLDGDGHVDLASINADGSADRYRYVVAGDRFQLESLTAGSLPGSPCRIGPWLGAARLSQSGPPALVALACPGSMTSDSWEAVYVFPGGAVPGAVKQIDSTGIRAAALADVDGDGLDDLLLANGQGEVEIRRAPSFDAATTVPLGPPATLIAAGDFDGDGDADLVVLNGSLRIYENLGAPGFAEKRMESGLPTALLVRDLDLDGKIDFAWVEEGKVEIRRNLGNFVFAPLSLTTGAGVPLSLSAGDFEGDGDPDLAVTVSTSVNTRSTRTYLFVNQVR